MRSFYVKSDNPIYLGRVGENDATQVIFDISYMVNKFGEGTVSLIAQREGDTDPYPCVIERSGNKVTWKITNADNARAGKGSCELRYMVGDTIAKSEVWETIVWESLGEHGDSVPEPYQSWVDQVLEAASKIGSAQTGFVLLDTVSGSEYSLTVTDGKLTMTEVIKE